MLEFSYRFQTLHNDSYTSKVQLEKPSKSIIVTKLINLYSDYVRISLDTLQVFIFGCFIISELCFYGCCHPCLHFKYLDFKTYQKNMWDFFYTTKVNQKLGNVLSKPTCENIT